MVPPAAALAVLLLLSAVRAIKDGDYYADNFVNPNTNRDMYWKDSINVLEDLDMFEALYITYHQCVWTKYGKRYGSGENYDEQGQDEADDDGNGCGGFGGEYFWYMGRTQCFKANVAFSLYGILKGESVPDDACTGTTYINSFFTTYGPESFTGPLGLGVDTANSYCTAEAPDNMYLDDDKAAVDDDYLDDNYQFYDYKSFTSYGTGCQADGSFAIDSYKGAFCHGKNYIATLDTLTQFNRQMQSFSCTQIYNANNQEGGNDNNGWDDDDYDFEEMDAISILSFSKSCSLRQYPKDCPDPFGLKRKYANSINKAFYFRGEGAARKILTYATYVIGICGCALFVSACWLKRARIRRGILRNRRVRSTKKQRGDFDSMGSTGNEKKKRSYKKSRRPKGSKASDIALGAQEAGASRSTDLSTVISKSVSRASFDSLTEDKPETSRRTKTSKRQKRAPRSSGRKSSKPQPQPRAVSPVREAKGVTRGTKQKSQPASPFREAKEIASPTPKARAASPHRGKRQGGVGQKSRDRPASPFRKEREVVRVRSSGGRPLVVAISHSTLSSDA